jgi:hypothetical protein
MYINVIAEETVVLACGPPCIWALLNGLNLRVSRSFGSGIFFVYQNIRALSRGKEDISPLP